MGKQIDSNQVLEVAKLARLEISDDQIADFQFQFARILDYVGQLEQLKLPDELEPFFGAVEAVNACRADEIVPSLQRDIILNNAPQTDGECYLVPPVF